MKKKCRNILMSVVLAAAILITVILLTAYHGNGEEISEKKYVFVDSFVAVEAGDRLRTELSENRLYYAQSVLDGYELYVSDMDTRQQEKIYAEYGGKGRFHVMLLSAAPDGKMAFLKYRDQQSDDEMSAREYVVTVLEPEGQLRTEYDVSAYLGGGTMLESMLLDYEGNVYLLLDGAKGSILALGPDGELKGTFYPEGTVRALLTDGGDHVYCVCGFRELFGEKLRVMEIPSSGKELTEVCRIDSGSGRNALMAGNREGILLSEGDVLYQVDLESGEKKVLFRWTDMEIDYRNIIRIVFRDNGEIGVCTSYVDANIGQLCYKVTIFRS